MWWVDFETAAPGLAAQTRELIERFRFVLIGTIRRDGTPRISPVEAHIVDGELVMAMIPGSLKAKDLLRDQRIVVNTPVVDASDPNTIEIKLRGRAISVSEDSLRAATPDAIERASGWRPPSSWHVFAIDVDEAACLRWNEGVLTLDRWTPEHGTTSVTRPVAVLDRADGTR